MPTLLLIIGSITLFGAHLFTPPGSLAFWLTALATLLLAYRLVGLSLSLGLLLLVDAFGCADLYADDRLHSLFCPLAVLVGGILLLVGLLVGFPTLRSTLDDAPDGDL